MDGIKKNRQVKLVGICRKKDMSSREKGISFSLEGNGRVLIRMKLSYTERCFLF